MHREEYYELLQRVRLEGVWEQWLQFFFTGIKETAEQAVSAAQRINEMFERDRARIQAIRGAAGSALQVHYIMRNKPVISMKEILRSARLTRPTVYASLNRLENLGIVKRIDWPRRGLLFVYSEYLQILNEGTEPLPT